MTLDARMCVCGKLRDVARVRFLLLDEGWAMEVIRERGMLAQIDGHVIFRGFEVTMMMIVLGEGLGAVV